MQTLLLLLVVYLRKGQTAAELLFSAERTTKPLRMLYLQPCFGLYAQPHYQATLAPAGAGLALQRATGMLAHGNSPCAQHLGHLSSQAESYTQHAWNHGHRHANLVWAEQHCVSAPPVVSADMFATIMAEMRLQVGTLKTSTAS